MTKVSRQRVRARVRKNRTKGKKQTRTEGRKRLFLKNLIATGTITAAALASHLPRTAHYEWMEHDPSYPARFAEAQEQCCDLAESEALSRGKDGWLEPVFHQGKQTDTKLVKSDTLLMFWLNGRRPDVFNRGQRHELTGKNGGPIQTQQVPDSELDRRIAELEVEIYGTKRHG